MIRKERNITITISRNFANKIRLKDNFGRINTDDKVIEEVGLTVPYPTILQVDTPATILERELCVTEN